MNKILIISAILYSTWSLSGDHCSLTLQGSYNNKPIRKTLVVSQANDLEDCKDFAQNYVGEWVCFGNKKERINGAWSTFRVTSIVNKVEGSFLNTSFKF